MPKLRVHNFSVSLDGYGAGPDQGPDDPLGVGGPRLHDWILATPTFARVVGETVTSGAVTSGTVTSGAIDKATELDDASVARGEAGIGATIMGRNMFGPIRGPWPDTRWRGWWGDEPPFHHAVFVLTHHARESISMRGGTTFHFVDPDSEGGGIATVLERAFESAAGQDVKLGGGVATIAQFLRAGLIDEMHVAFVPILLGGGERLFDQHR